MNTAFRFNIRENVGYKKISLNIVGSLPYIAHHPVSRIIDTRPSACIYRPVLVHDRGADYRASSSLDALTLGDSRHVSEHFYARRMPSVHH